METATRTRFSLKKAPEIKAFPVLNVRRCAAVWQSPPSACVGWSSRIPGSISAGCYWVQRAFRTVRRSVYAAGKYWRRVLCRRAEPPADKVLAQQRIGNHLRAHAALAVVQRQAVAAIIVGAQPPDQPVAACLLGGRQALDLIQPSSPLSPSHS